MYENDIIIMSKINEGVIIFTLGFGFLSVGLTSFVVGFSSDEALEMFQWTNNATDLDQKIQDSIESKEWRNDGLRWLGMAASLVGLFVIKLGMDKMNRASQS